MKKLNIRPMNIDGIEIISGITILKESIIEIIKSEIEKKRYLKKRMDMPK
jgi:hypothetical protein